MRSHKSKYMYDKDRIKKAIASLDTKRYWFSSSFNLSTPQVANIIATASIMPSILYGSEVHPISETMVILTNKVAKLTARAYYKENVADTLQFLGWLPACKLEE